MKTAHSKVHAALSKELAGLLPSLDEEGLAFLVEQARVHLRNMEIDRLNAEIEADEARSSADAGDGPPGGGGARGKRKKAAVPGDVRRRADFRIERSATGSSYHVISGGKWKMFTDDEMLAMVKICSSDDDVREVTDRLYTWLDAERPDAFADLELEGPHDPKMAELVELLRAKFKIRKR